MVKVERRKRRGKGDGGFDNDLQHTCLVFCCIFEGVSKFYPKYHIIHVYPIVGYIT